MMDVKVGRLTREAVFGVIGTVTGEPLSDLTIKTVVAGMDLVKLETQLDVRFGAVVELVLPSQSIEQIFDKLGI